jgi:Flp pilus assembly protein TadG
MISTRQTKKHARRATATVEFAVCIPLMLLFICGGIEICQRIMLRQTATLTAYEGLRLAVRRYTTTAMVQSRCDSILRDRGIKNATVAITPTSIENQVRNTPIRINVTIPWQGNTPLRFLAGTAGEIRAQGVMVRE